MSFDGSEKANAPHEQASQSAQTSGPSIAPGKRTLTMRLPPGLAGAGAPVQQKAGPTADAELAERMEVARRGADTAVRPDHYPPPVQRKGMGVGTGAGDPLSQPVGGSGRPMPENVQAKMEHAFGADFSAVRIHEGPQATSMGALAYTQGTDIHFSLGQHNPGSQRGQELLGHELAHVVQQSQGRVQATMQAKGLPINDDPSLERKADVMGAKAARGEFVDGMAPADVTRSGSSALRVRQRLVARQPAQRAIQHSPVNTWAGEFKADKYERTSDAGMDGVDIVLRFTPKDPANAKKIGLTQSVRSRDSEGAVIVGSGKAQQTLKDRTIPEGQDGAGTRIEQLSTHGNPLYATDKPGAGDALGDTPTKDFWGRHGCHYRNAAGEFKSDYALLKDTPQLSFRRKESSQVFETTALAMEGEQAGTYYGSVQWGWQKDAAGKVTKLPLTLISNDAPSAVFSNAAKLWNQGKTSEGNDSLDLSTVTAKYTSAEAEMVGDPAKQKERALHKLAKDTWIEITGTNATWSKVTVVDGTSAGSVGWVMSSALSENESK